GQNFPCRKNRHGGTDCKIDKHSAGKIEHREEVEVGCEPEVIGHACGDQPTDQIACDIARDVCGKCAAGMRCATLFTQIGEHKSKGRRHAETLRDPQNCKCGEIRCDSE